MPALHVPRRCSACFAPAGRRSPPNLPHALLPVSLSGQQVALNQLCLAPITITVAFTWNLALTGQLDQLPGELYYIVLLMMSPLATAR